MVMHARITGGKVRQWDAEFGLTSVAQLQAVAVQKHTQKQGTMAMTYVWNDYKLMKWSHATSNKQIEITDADDDDAKATWTAYGNMTEGPVRLVDPSGKQYIRQMSNAYDHSFQTCYNGSLPKFYIESSGTAHSHKIYYLSTNNPAYASGPTDGLPFIAEKSMFNGDPIPRDTPSLKAALGHILRALEKC
jgi:hypothetical protein